MSISINSEESRRMCLYYWFNGEGNSNYVTWDGLKKVKAQLEKEHRKVVFKRCLVISAIPIFIVYVAFLNWLIIKLPWLRPYYMLCCIPITATFPTIIMCLSSPKLGNEYHLYRLRRFKEMYANEFNLEEGFWKNVKTGNEGESGGKLEILEHMSRIASRC